MFSSHQGGQPGAPGMSDEDDWRIGLPLDLRCQFRDLPANRGRGLHRLEHAASGRETTGDSKQVARRARSSVDYYQSIWRLAVRPRVHGLTTLLDHARVKRKRDSGRARPWTGLSPPSPTTADQHPPFAWQVRTVQAH